MNKFSFSVWVYAKKKLLILLKSQELGMLTYLAILVCITLTVRVKNKIDLLQALISAEKNVNITAIINSWMDLENTLFYLR